MKLVNWYYLLEKHFVGRRPVSIRGSVAVPSDNKVCVIPSYENLKWRFLQGRGEINIGSENGPASTLWEFLIHAQDADCLNVM